MSEEEFDFDADDLEAIEAELAALGSGEEDDIDMEDLSDEDLLSDEDDLDNYTEEELRALEEEVASLEKEEQEDPQDFQESGNLIIGALQRPKYANLMSNLEQELEKEAEELKRLMRDVIPKYLVNPFALPNRIDYEEIFDDIDPEEPDLKIWKIELFEPVPLSLKELGKFYSGDCYVLLYITEAFEGGIVINIHHWIGEQATVDKFGAAAYRAVELNMFMGGRCHIYRELEGKESQLFLDYFEGRIEYLVGGTAKGFRHIKTNSPKEYKPILYQLIPQSSGHLIMRRENLEVSSLSSEFVYILDAGKRIYQWNGMYVANKHRHRALAHCHTIRSNERAGLASVYVFNEGKPDELLTYEEDIFWRYLKGRKEAPLLTDERAPRTIEKRFIFEDEDAEDLDVPILAVSVAGSWDNFYRTIPMVKGEEGWDLSIPLANGTYQYQYKVATQDGVHSYCDIVRDTKTSQWGEVNIVNALVDDDQYYSLWGTNTNEQGKMGLTEVEVDGYLERSMLRSKNAFILDCSSEIFVWVGRYCKPMEKQVAMAIAKQIYHKYERPEWTPILGIYESAETTTFTSKFRRWDYLQSYQCKPKSSNKKRKKKNSHIRFDLPAIVNVEAQLREMERLSSPMIDDGSGSTEVRLFTLRDGASSTPIPTFARGVFFMESCYVILYKYDAVVRGSVIKKFLVYFWSGIACSNADAIYAKFVLGFLKMLLDRVGPYRLKAERILQGKEPKQFFRMFKGRAVYKQGAQNSYSKHLSNNTLYDIYITSHLVNYPKIQVTEVRPSTASLTSSRCSLLFTKEQIYLYSGQYSFPEEKDVGKRICSFISESNYHPLQTGDDCIIIEERDMGNEESTVFRSLLAEEGDGTSFRSSVGRLYAVTHANGFFDVFEVEDYAQYDLLTYQSSVLLLHTLHTLFIWQGSHATGSLLLDAQKVAEHWVSKVAELRGQNSAEQSLVVCQQGNENAAFCTYFPGWQEGYMKDYDVVTRKQEDNYQSMKRERAAMITLQTKLDTLHNQIELLELISSSSEYSKAEEKAINAKFNVVNISFDKELIALGLMKAPPTPTIDRFQVFKDNIVRGEILFHWKAPGALAVAVKGSWNNWEQIPLVKYGAHGFALKIALEPGRYYFSFLVATQDGATLESVDSFPSTWITPMGESERQRANILRVYKCTHPTFLEEKRRAKEDEESAKKHAEEEANKTLSAEEFTQKQREWKEHQRIANEERLRRQLEEKRRNRTLTAVTIASTKEDLTEELLDEPAVSETIVRPSARRARPTKSIFGSSSDAYSKTLLTRTEGRTVPSDDKSTQSYREKRRAELGLGSRPSSTSDTPATTSDTPSRSSRSFSTTESPTRSSRYSTESSESSTKSSRPSRHSTESSDSPTRSSRSSRSSSTTENPTRSSRYSTESSDSPTKPSRSSSATESPTRSSRYSTESSDSSTRSSRSSRYSTESSDSSTKPSRSSSATESPTRSSRYSTESSDSSTRSSRSSRYSTESSEPSTTKEVIESPTRSSRTSRYSDPPKEIEETQTRTSRTSKSTSKPKETPKETPASSEAPKGETDRERKRRERRIALGLA